MYTEVFVKLVCDCVFLPKQSEQIKEQSSGQFNNKRWSYLKNPLRINIPKYMLQNMNRKETLFVHLKICLHNYESEGDIKNRFRSKVPARSTGVFFLS